jgi:hypothetical protein
LTYKICDFSVYFDFARYLRPENGNSKKNALSKIESQCHAYFWIENHLSTFREKRIQSWHRHNKLAADLKILNAASSLNRFFLKSTKTIFDSKICLESAWHWLSILLKAFCLNCRFQVINNAQSQTIGRGLKNLNAVSSLNTFFSKST